MKGLAPNLELQADRQNLSATAASSFSSARSTQESTPFQWPEQTNRDIAEGLHSQLLKGVSDLRLVNSGLTLETLKGLAPRTGFSSVTFVLRVGTGASVSDGVPLDALSLFSGAEAVRRVVGADRLLGIVILEGAPEQRASMPLELSEQRSRAAFGYLALAQALKQAGMPVDLFLDTDLMGNDEYDTTRQRLKEGSNFAPESALHEAAVIHTAANKTDSRLFVGWASEESLEQFKQIQQFGPGAVHAQWVSGGILQTRDALERAGLLEDKGFVCLKTSLSVNPHSLVVRPDVINPGESGARLRLDSDNSTDFVKMGETSPLSHKASLKALSRYLELALSINQELPKLGLVSEPELQRLKRCSSERVNAIEIYRANPTPANTENLRGTIKAQEIAMQDLVLNFQKRAIGFFGRCFKGVGFTPERALIKNDTFDPSRMTSTFERKPTYVPRTRGRTLETSLGLDRNHTSDLVPYRDLLKVHNARMLLSGEGNESKVDDDLALVS